MAVVWYVTLFTSSGAWTAAFSICSYLPQFLISIPGGVWADRFSRKRLILSSDLFSALITLAMIVLMPYLSTEPSLLSPGFSSCLYSALSARGFRLRQ